MMERIFFKFLVSISHNKSRYWGGAGIAFILVLEKCSGSSERSFERK